MCFFRYQGAIKEGIRRLKYRRRSSLAPLLASLVCDRLSEWGINFDQESIIVPVPLHWYKQYLRGYNQAILLGQAFSEYLGLKLAEKAVIKAKNTQSQTKCTQQERSTNVHDSFVINPRYESILTGKHVIVIDDVLTTGSTLKEVTKVLKIAGVKGVSWLVIARS